MRKIHDVLRLHFDLKLAQRLIARSIRISQSTVNARTAVNKASRYEPDLNPTYQEMAEHYGVGVVPARVRKPRDKAKVEVGVQVAQRWIVAALRHRRFLSLADLNVAIAELVEKLNRRPFRFRESSHRMAILAVDHMAVTGKHFWTRAAANASLI